MKPESQEKEEPIKIQEAVDARIDKVSSLSFSLSLYIYYLYMRTIYLSSESWFEFSLWKRRIKLEHILHLDMLFIFR